MNNDKFEFLGINKWHKAGYTGKGITIASRESLTTHGKKVLDIIQQICPDARILYKQNYQKTVDNAIDIYTTSMFSVSDKYEKSQESARALYAKDVFLCCAIGNDGDEKQEFLSTQPEWCSIGACIYNNGKLTRAYYSSISDTLDYMSITNMETIYGTFTGTSCATPVFASMLVLVQQFFKSKCGRKLTNKELLHFINDNTHDIGEKGFDSKTGNGVFILPNPEDIDIKNYTDCDIIELTIGSSLAFVNGKRVLLDTEPIIHNNRTLVPIRFIAEALNCQVQWDNDNRKVYILK